MGTSPGRTAPIASTSNLLPAGLAGRTKWRCIPRATFRSLGPHSPSEAPCTAHAGLRAKVLHVPVSADITKHLSCHVHKTQAAALVCSRNVLPINTFGGSLARAATSCSGPATGQCHPSEVTLRRGNVTFQPVFSRSERVLPRG